MEIAIPVFNHIFDPFQGLIQKVIGIAFLDKSTGDNLGIIQHAAVLIQGQTDQDDTIPGQEPPPVQANEDRSQHS